jgi:membrane fusion protein (multidrug efflux system)
MQVVAVEAVRQSVDETLALVGSFAANEQVEIKAESDGFVEAIRFTEGQEVAKGASLVTLDETKLQASLEEAEAALKLSRQTFERSEELLRVRLISQQEYDQAASRLSVDQATVALRRRQLKEARVSAPFEGVVGARQVSPGQLVTRATTLTWLVDLDPLKVEFNVPERFLSQVQVGQAIDVTVAAWPGRKFTGKVFFVAPFVEADTRTVLMKAEVPNSERLLKPGMFASLELTLQVRDNAIVVPEAALSQILDGDRALVMVVAPDETVAMRPVRIGMRLPGRVEILEGLQGDEKVIVEGHQKIGPGMKVRLAPPEAAAPYAPPKAA